MIKNSKFTLSILTILPLLMGAASSEDVNIFQSAAGPLLITLIVILILVILLGLPAIILAILNARKYRRLWKKQQEQMVIKQAIAKSKKIEQNKK